MSEFFIIMLFNILILKRLIDAGSSGKWRGFQEEIRRVFFKKEWMGESKMDDVTDILRFLNVELSVEVFEKGKNSEEGTIVSISDDIFKLLG